MAPCYGAPESEELVQANYSQEHHTQSGNARTVCGALGGLFGSGPETEPTPDVGAALADDHVCRALSARAGQVRRDLRA